MTDPYTGAPTYDSSLDEVVDDADQRTASLDRRADDLLAQAEGRSYAPVTSVRQAVRDDIDHGREWARGRVARTRDVIQDQPLKTTAYAVGLGVLIGMLLRR